MTAATPAIAPFGKHPLRTFALLLALPVMLFYAASTVAVYMALSMMNQHVNRIEDQRELSAVNLALAGFINGLSSAVADEGTWNDAYLNVVVSPSPAWMDTTWGATARLGATYDEVMVTDALGNIVFGENSRGQIRGAIKARYPAAETMLTELDRAISQSGDAAVISHFVASGQSAAGLAAISIHRFTEGEGVVPRHTRRILWIAKQVDARLLQDIAARHQLPLASIVVTPPAGMSSLDISDIDGKVISTIAWTPDQPAEAAFRQALIVVSLLVLGIGVLLALGLILLRRAMLRRAAAIEVAFANLGAAPIVAAPAAAAGAITIAAAAPSAAPAEAGNSAIAGVSAVDFTVEYQPILDLRAETMTGVKALLRWKRPDGTPLFEEDLSVDDRSALMERAGIMALRHATGELGPLLGVMLGFTVTPQQLLSSVFAEKIAGTIGATNFPARRLQLNVECSQLPPAETLAEPIAELRRMGVSVVFAGFSLGAASLAYLRPGLADRISLDPAVIAVADTDALALRLIEATLDAARTAEIAVTVPAIERPAQASKLLRLGCREFRGPLLAKPLGLGPLTNLILAPARPQAKAS